jgi:hypothetical protein
MHFSIAAKPHCYTQRTILQRLHNLSARLAESFLQSFVAPRRLLHPTSWVGHWPFGVWLVSVLRPKSIVELGSHTGNSLFCFAQACAEHGIDAHLHAVDTWQGDAHAGSYSEEVFTDVQAHAREHYPGMITLHRKTFDEAVSDIAPGSVDLLHIDGLHTYEAVRHDFHTWRSRCSDHAIVLFHDTAVRREDFGVHRFWEEIIAGYQHFEFVHSNGLGVLMLGSQVPPVLEEFFQTPANHGAAETIRKFFASAGDCLVRQTDRQVELSHALASYTTNYHAERHLRLLAEQKIKELQSSNSWRLTAPLRWLRSLIVKR